jgi:hypothetical protein
MPYATYGVMLMSRNVDHHAVKESLFFIIDRSKAD